MLLLDLRMRLDLLTTLMIAGVKEIKLVCHFSHQKILDMPTIVKLNGLMNQVIIFGCGFLKHLLTKHLKSMLFVQEIIFQDGITRCGVKLLVLQNSIVGIME